jgi:hypothetical protein
MARRPINDPDNGFQIYSFNTESEQNRFGDSGLGCVQFGPWVEMIGYMIDDSFGADGTSLAMVDLICAQEVSHTDNHDCNPDVVIEYLQGFSSCAWAYVTSGNHTGGAVVFYRTSGPAPDYVPAWSLDTSTTIELLGKDAANPNCHYLDFNLAPIVQLRTPGGRVLQLGSVHTLPVTSTDAPCAEQNVPHIDHAMGTHLGSGWNIRIQAGDYNSDDVGQDGNHGDYDELPNSHDPVSSRWTHTIGSSPGKHPCQGDVHTIDWLFHKGGTVYQSEIVPWQVVETSFYETRARDLESDCANVVSVTWDCWNPTYGDYLKNYSDHRAVGALIGW